MRNFCIRFLCLALFALPLIGSIYGCSKKSNKISGPPNRPFNREETGQNFLLTFPRSGTNLVSCYIQGLTQRPIWLIDQKSSPHLANNRLSLSLDYSKTPIYRSHKGDRFEGLNKSGNKLILIVRNYKECIHRESSYQSDEKFVYRSDEEFANFFLKMEPIVKNYIKNLATYDQWDPQNRLLIFYEDLMTSPLEQVTRILSFFGEPIPPYLTGEFLQSIGDQTLESYHSQHKKTGGSHTKGKDLKFHSNQISPSVLVEIDAAMKQANPHLWETYLNRYQTDI